MLYLLHLEISSIKPEFPNGTQGLPDYQLEKNALFTPEFKEKYKTQKLTTLHI